MEGKSLGEAKENGVYFYLPVYAYRIRLQRSRFVFDGARGIHAGLLSPLRGFVYFSIHAPTADAVGYFLCPLRGLAFFTLVHMTYNQ